MPHYREKLLSAWSEDPVYELGFLPPKIDPDVMKHLVPAVVGLRGVNPKKTYRNQAEKLSILDSDGTALAAPKFLSEKSRTMKGDGDKERCISDAESFTDHGVAGNTKADVPVMYRLMEIKYSRYGVDDFDFGCVLLPHLYACKYSIDMIGQGITTKRNTLDLKPISRTPT